MKLFKLLCFTIRDKEDKLALELLLQDSFLVCRHLLRHDLPEAFVGNNRQYNIGCLQIRQLLL